MKTTLVLALGVSGLGLHFYHQDVQAETPSAAQAAPQAMSVTIDIAEAKPVQIWKSFSARMSAVNFAEIRPQVSGTITEIRFVDGQSVTKGDVLYVIDPRPFQASVQQVKAELAAAQNDAQHNQKEFVRAKGLLKTQAISQRIYDERANTALIAQTTGEGAKARLLQAEINLDHAFVKAPFTGRVSRAEITLGNLVEAGSSAPLLTSIVSSDGIYADFDVDEQTYLTHIRSVAKNKAAENKIPVKLTFGSTNTAEPISYDGVIHSFDNRIDGASGTIRARAYFTNSDTALLSGMFSNIQLGSAISQDHIMINEKAISTNQDRKFVYVIDVESKVAYREVTMGNNVGNKRIISKGLENGDQVITEGIIRIRPGMLVEPKAAAKAVTAPDASEIKLTQAK
jgi:multidrug efflux system membrane fusion protein